MLNNPTVWSYNMWYFDPNGETRLLSSVCVCVCTCGVHSPKLKVCPHDIKLYQHVLELRVEEGERERERGGGGGERGKQ